MFQGFDPLAKQKFVPKFKKKGRSSAGAVERRKKQVAHEDQRVSNHRKFSWQINQCCAFWFVLWLIFWTYFSVRM